MCVTCVCHKNCIPFESFVKIWLYFENVSSKNVCLPKMFVCLKKMFVCLFVFQLYYIPHIPRLIYFVLSPCGDLWYDVYNMPCFMVYIIRWNKSPIGISLCWGYLWVIIIKGSRLDAWAGYVRGCFRNNSSNSWETIMNL